VGLFTKKPARLPLAKREMALNAAELDNVLYTVGGAYDRRVDDTVVQAARKVFTKHLKLGPYPDTWEGTAYLEADTDGRTVWVTIDGRRVSRLTDAAAALLHPRIDAPVPVKAYAMLVGVTKLPSLALSPKTH
jgi:hypothetical protein